MQSRRQRIGLVRRTDQRAEPADVIEDADHAAVIADPHLDTAPDQLGRNVGLDIGKPDHEIRFELEDLADLGRGERANLRLLAPRDRRPHREPGNPDDAILLAKQV